MGGNFDWQGISQGAGDIGKSLIQTRQQAAIEEEQQAERDLRAAQIQLQATEGLPIDNPARQAALRAYQDAVRRYTKNKAFALPTKKVGGKPAVPAVTATVPVTTGQETEAREQGQAPKKEVTFQPAQPEVPGQEILTMGGEAAGPITFREYAKMAGITLTPDQDLNLGDRPATEVINLFPNLKQNKPLSTDRNAVVAQISMHSQRIAAAGTPVERAQAVDEARRYKLAVLAEDPSLASLFPDYAAAGQQYTREAAAVLEATQAAGDRKTWQTNYQKAWDDYLRAHQGTDAFAVREAIIRRNAYIEQGIKQGWLPKGTKLIPVDEAMREWLTSVAKKIEAEDLTLQEKRARVARIRQQIAEAGKGGGGGGGGGQPVPPADPNDPYQIVNYKDRRGNLTKQVVIDRRTGKVVSEADLAARAKAGDQYAARLRGQPKLDPREELAQLTLEWRQLRNAVGSLSLASPKQKIEAAKRLREVEARMRQLGAQITGGQPATAPTGGGQQTYETIPDPNQFPVGAILTAPDGKKYVVKLVNGKKKWVALK